MTDRLPPDYKLPPVHFAPRQFPPQLKGQGDLVAEDLFLQEVFPNCVKADVKAVEDGLLVEGLQA